jgi:hypothetical protein
MLQFSYTDSAFKKKTFEVYRQTDTFSQKAVKAKEHVTHFYVSRCEIELKRLRKLSERL